MSRSGSPRPLPSLCMANRCAGTGMRSAPPAAGYPTLSCTKSRPRARRRYTYEKEIVMYAYFKRLDYFSTECVYAPFAARGAARDFVKDLEARPPARPARRAPGIW